MEKQHVTLEYEKAIQYIYSLMQDGTNRTYDSGDVRNRKKFDQGGTQYPAWHGNDRTRTGIGKLYIKKCRRVDPSDAYDDAGTWQYHEIRGL